MPEELEHLILETSRLTHKVADTLVLPKLTGSDYNELAEALEELALVIRRIPNIKALSE